MSPTGPEPTFRNACCLVVNGCKADVPRTSLKDRLRPKAQIRLIAAAATKPPSRRRRLIAFGDKFPSLQRSLVIVFFFCRSLGKLDLFMRDFLVRDPA